MLAQNANLSAHWDPCEKFPHCTIEPVNVGRESQQQQQLWSLYKLLNSLSIPDVCFLLFPLRAHAIRLYLTRIWLIFRPQLLTWDWTWKVCTQHVDFFFFNLTSRPESRRADIQLFWNWRSTSTSHDQPSIEMSSSGLWFFRIHFLSIDFEYFYRRRRRGIFQAYQTDIWFKWYGESLIQDTRLGRIHQCSVSDVKKVFLLFECARLFLGWCSSEKDTRLLQEDEHSG